VARIVDAPSNIRAFLDMLAVSEGTANRGDDGYNVLVGGTLFRDYTDHPRIYVPLPRLNIVSSAAGRYQFLWGTWVDLRNSIDLPDFSPVSQDLACIELIKRAGAYAAVLGGNIHDAITKCAKTWASLPGAGYGQRENAEAQLVAAYTRSGGEELPQVAVDAAHAVNALVNVFKGGLCG
jgi:muramidase (phage lysozyme)